MTLGIAMGLFHSALRAGQTPGQEKELLRFRKCSNEEKRREKIVYTEHRKDQSRGTLLMVVVKFTGRSWSSLAHGQFQTHQMLKTPLDTQTS